MSPVGPLPPGSVAYLDQVLGEDELVRALIESALVRYG